ncbi:hypothetical protein ABPG74_009342 [Tetrahymena malaccensis]
MDQRKEYLLNCITALLKLSEFPEKLSNSSTLDKFLNDSDKNTLPLLYVQGKGFKVYSYNDSQQPEGLIITLSKTTNETITPLNVNRVVSITLMSSNPVDQLYTQLSNFYLPALKEKSDPSITKLLEELKMNLSGLKQGSGNGNFDDADENNVKFIFKPVDELDFWIRMQQSTAASNQIQRKAAQYSEQLSQIDKIWKDINKVEFSGIKEAIDQTLAVMDKIWRLDSSQQGYPEVRMRKFFEVCMNTLIARFQQEFNPSEIWDVSQSQVRLKLNEGQLFLKHFNENITLYTTQLWTQGRRWTSGQIDLTPSNNTIQRINEILELREQYEELVKMQQISNGKLKGDFESAYSIFRQINCLNASENTKDQWNTAKTKFNQQMEEIDDEVQNILKKDILAQNVKENMMQIFRDMQSWNGLLNRPKIKKDLQNERSNILQSIRQIVEQIQNEFETKSGENLDPVLGSDAIPSGHNFSKILNSIVWGKSLSGKLKRIMTISQTSLGDLREYGGFKQYCEQLSSQINEYQNDQFNSWKSEAINQISKPESKVSLEITGRMMDINLQNGLVEVNYSERLVLLIREVRQLFELGFKKDIPKQIVEVVENGKRFYKEALNLKQIANFYNSMSSVIPQCLQKMLADKAMKFENIILNPKVGVKKQQGGQNQGNITWNNADELEDYIKKVQEAANDIMNENRRLRKLHMSLIEQVIFLFDVDLVKNKHVWKEKLEAIKKTIDIGCQGKDPSICNVWKYNWDIQLYKALEHQYQRGLQMLDQNLQEMNADIVLKGKNIEFRPPFEELKEKYYREIRAFINWPAKNFQGVGGSSEVYSAMPKNNAQYLSVVYAKAEKLFEKLQNLLEKFRNWTVIGYLDSDKVEEKLQDIEDWEFNIKNIRTKRKELEKLQDSYKIECFNVNLTPFKNSADDLLQNFIDNLTNSLKNSVKSDCEILEEFVTNSLEKLSNKPKTMEEMNAAKSSYFELKGQKKPMQQKLNNIQVKNKLLRNLVGFVQNTSNIEKRWENFELAIGDFDNILAEQTKTIKQEIGKRSEGVNQEIDKFFAKWQNLKPKQTEELDKEQARELAAKMKEWRNDWAEIEKKVEAIQKDCDHFEMDQPAFVSLSQVRRELQSEESQWKVFDDFSSELETFEKEDWLVIKGKLYDFQDFTMKWTEQLKQQTKRDAVSQYMIDQIERFKQIWTGLRLCIGEAFEREHWRSLFGIFKLPKDVTLETLKFGHLLDADKEILLKMNDLKDLAARAQGEVALREAIQELKQWCDTYDFELTEHNSNGRQTPLIKEWKDLLTKVSDNQSLLASMKESKFYARFQDQIEGFEQKLGGVDEYLGKLQVIQRKWVYLEPIFGRGALPAEQGRFKRLDDDFRSIMLGIERDPKVVSLCVVAGIKDTLETILDQLERCQKALNDFLEEKRSKFPRFYFLGDDDLLEILGQSQNAQVIQMHLKKLFAGINKVEFNKDCSQILAMISSQKETVQLNEKVQVEEQVENWLNSLSRNMVKTLQKLLVECLTENSLEADKYPSQILCISEEIKFTEKAVGAIRGGKLANYKADLAKMLEQFTKLVGGAPLLIQLKLKALILDLIHHIEVIDVLIDNNVQDVQDWFWYKQLKYEMNQKKNGEIIMCRARFDYTYEYQGNAPKLVHTPLTDKCYLTLTQGMDMGYGGNPYGPAGTGKTESVKALGQAFGRQVLVFNCDEGLDFKSMGRIFIGLVKCGAWGCFDEFNRLLEEQLSAISQQIQVIQWAIKEGEQTMQLMGQTIEVNKNSGIFVTLNPAGKGYGGRSKLPDNLKQLFRPVAMSVPDNELIAETLLYSEGFKYAKELSQKVISIFTLSRQLLSPQQHYDWGLRALKTILTVAGQLIQAERQKTPNISREGEAELLIKAIRINTMSKLTFSDTRKFVALVQDVFPGIKSEDIVYAELTKAVEEVLAEMKLDVIETQISKILQFYEACKQRMGVVLVGPSGCGKTTIWKTLKKAYEKMGTQVKAYVMNPKSMPRSQLLGLMNNDTREFTEGVLTSSAREVIKESSDVISWIICDGDIDPEWIESLNSVLDDNHLLTLPTGERISFQDNVNFIFETNDLQYASPATVSRMGMIFLNQEDISIKSVVNKWVKRQKEELQAKLENLLEEYFYKILQYVQQFEEEQVVQTTRIGLVMNVLSQLTSIQSKSEFVTQMLRGFCSNFSLQIRVKIANEIFSLSGDKPPCDLNNSPLDFVCINGSLRPLSILSQDISLSDFADSEEPPIIQTIGLQRDFEFLKPWIINCEPFIVCGPEGSGKSLLIRAAFNELRKQQKIQVATIYCNAQTTAAQIIQKLNQICMKGTFSQGRILKPKDASRLVLYLKDINLPKPDKYQTIQLIAFLQQIITHKGYYDEQLEFVYLDEKIQIVASMAPSSTIGRHEISTRFTANARIHYISYPSKEELMHTYTEYSRAIFQSEKVRIEKNQAAQIAKKFSLVLIDFYTNFASKFNVDEHRHYSFTPRNLTQIVFGMLRYEIGQSNPDSIGEALYNEVSKRFRDRLVNFEQQNKFDTFIGSLLRSHLSYQVTPNIFFSSVGGQKQLTRLEKKDYIVAINQGLLMYEREFKEMKLHLLDEVLSLLSSLDRCLSQSGSVLLAGRSGIGRKSCISLMATMLRMEIVSPSTSRDYSTREFKKELKVFLEKAAAQNKQVILYIEDHHLVKSEFLELLNSLISSGEIPGLFTQDEVDHSFQNADEVRRENYGRSLYDIFCMRVRQNLRVVLSMDHSEETFASNCASNPAFFTKCTVVWLNNWSKESMSVIMKEELKEMLENFPAKEKEDIASYFINIHKYGLDHSRASPSHLFALAHTYSKIYQKKVNSRGSQSSHLKKGLGKLQEAKELVDVLQKQAQVKKQELAVKQKEAANALDLITNAMKNAAERKSECEKIQEYLQSEEGKIQDQRMEVQRQLQEVEPLIQSAKKSVDNISKSDLDFLRNLMMPPPVIHNIMKGVLRVFNISDVDKWQTVRQFLSNRQVLEQIINFDPDIITPQVRRGVQAQIMENESSFRKEVSYNASKAAGPMADWTIAVLKYSEVNEKVIPLKNNLKAIDQRLNSSRQKLQENENELQKLEGKVEQLKQDFASKTSQAEILKNELKKQEETLAVASSLLDKLGDEKVRWEAQAQSIEKEFKSFPVESLLAAGFTIYLSENDENQREKAIQEWKQMTKSQTFNYLKFLSSEGQMLKWKSEGLPGDSLSLENSVMIFHSSKTPLLIDPNTQATEWLKKNLGTIEVLNQQDPKFSNQLELSVLFGKTLLIQELDKIEPILVPILRKDLVHQGPRWVVMIGDKYVNYNENFKLYLCTRNSGIEINANTSALVSIINYTVTKSGLEGKLLSIIINHEQPDLEKRKQELLENEEKLKIQLEELEKTLLEELASSTGNILENSVLIESLNQTKQKSQTIEVSLKESTKLQENLDQQREVYRNLAVKGAQLFISIGDLKKINNMYRFSLNYFIKLFKICLNVKEQFPNMQAKLQFCAVNLNRIIFNNIASSLFKHDRLMFGLHIVHDIYPEYFQQNEWDFLLGNTALAIESNLQIPKWANPECKDQYAVFVNSFGKLCNNINFNDREWEQWSKELQCERVFPQAYASKLTHFQKVLFVQVFRPERLQSSLNDFVCQSLQISSISGNPFSFNSIYQHETSTQTPALFVVSPGSDPSAELEEYAEQQIGRENFQEMSMGGNQNDIALEKLREAANKGYWLCLKNLHLVTAWLPILEKELKTLTPHQNFRLWLTTEAHIKFPAILLETCYKVSYESPPGLKKNVERIYSSWSPQYIAKGSAQRAQLLFLLAWFHAILQERRTYIPQGWSKFYEFSYGDLRAGTQIIEGLVQDTQQKGISWETLYGLFENAIYGGRIDEAFDMRVLRSYIELYFNNNILKGSARIPTGDTMPQTTNLPDYLAIVKKMSETDTPSIFGLPLNIDKAVQRYNTQQVISNLKIIMQASAEDLKFDKEKWQKQLGTIINLWKNLYKQFREGSGLPQIKPQNLTSTDPIESFVYLEASSAYQMLEKIESSIEGLNKVLFGNGLLTSEIQATGMELMLGNVPEKWSKVWEGPDNANSWLKGFCSRVYQLKKWVETLRSGSLLDSPLNLSDLFHPEIFLNALRQKTARKISKPLNDLKIVTSFDQSKISTAITIKIKHLLLQGCQINQGHLVDGAQDLPEFVQLPELYIGFIPKEEQDPYPSNTLGEFPIFSSSQREKLVAKIKIPVQGSLNDRIIAGVAFVLQNN